MSVAEKNFKRVGSGWHKDFPIKELYAKKNSEFFKNSEFLDFSI
jgi:hypothetical protein